MLDTNGSQVLSNKKRDISTSDIWHRLLLGAILILTLQYAGFGQTVEQDTAKNSLVIIDRADRVISQKDDTGQEVLILTGDVQLHQDSLFMACDSARKEQNNLFANGNVLLQQWDSLNIFSERLEYYGNTRDAFLRDSVVLQNKSQKLFTDSLAYNADTRIAVYDQGALLTNDTTFLYSRRGLYYLASDEVYFKDSVVIVSPDFQLFADTLMFNTKEEKAVFLGPTRIDLEDGGQVYCEAGFYDTKNNLAFFTQNARFEKEDQTAEADSIFYDGSTKEVRLIRNATLVEDGKRASADTIIYRETDEVVDLVGNALFEDSTRTMRSRELKYDLKNDKLTSSTRSRLDNGPQVLIADIIDFDNKAGLGVASGDIIWRDTVENHTILCDDAEYNDSTGYLKAFGGRPLFISMMDEDSFFLAADTMVSTEIISETGDTTRKFNAYYDVKIFKEDLQAICDSLTYSSTDSLFTLFKDPIIWSDTSQFVADTVQIQLSNSEIDEIYLKQNAFILNSADEILFNQMKGKEITASFKEGELNRMLIKGNAESIYYVLDEQKAYIGANEMLCSRMLLRFGNNEVTDITFYDSPTAKFHPIQDVAPGSLKLEGFDWRVDERPMGLFEISSFAVR